jgi:hypothetical protein
MVSGCVGWVERSETHQSVRGGVMGFVLLYPSCELLPAQSFRNTIDAIQPVISAMKAVISP